MRTYEAAGGRTRRRVDAGGGVRTHEAASLALSSKATTRLAKSCQAADMACHNIMRQLHKNVDFMGCLDPNIKLRYDIGYSAMTMSLTYSTTPSVMA